MSIGSSGHAASWVEEEHPGELLFTIVMDGGVSVVTQGFVTEQAYADARDDRHEFASDWLLVYIREPGRNSLDQAKLAIKESESNDGSGVKAWTLVVTSLVTHKVFEFGL